MHTVSHRELWHQASAELTAQTHKVMFHYIDLHSASGDSPCTLPGATFQNLKPNLNHSYTYMEGTQGIEILKWSI